MPSYVLVVDDDPDVRQLLSDIFEAMDIERRVVANGNEALRMVKEERPALILLDVMMPVMDGFTTLTRLHANPDNRGIPVILLSAIAEYNNRMAQLPGVVGVLRKGNFTLPELSDIVTEALGQKNDV